MPPPEIFVSTDIEADGPIPGLYSMLSFGSAAYLSDKTLVATFSANLETLPEASTHPDTMRWWQTQPAAWAACHTDLEPPEQAMRRYVSWLKALPGKPVFVAYPATFDFMFVYWYLIRFVGESPFSHGGLDIKTYAMAMLETPYHDSTKRQMPQRWFAPDLPHSHIALDDAKEHGVLFCNMKAEHHRESRRKLMAAAALIRNAEGDVLLVQPSYRPDWLLPGGMVEAQESPLAACRREVQEELGLSLPIETLLCLDYMPPSDRRESLQFVYWGGVLSADQIAKITLPSDNELLTHRFVNLETAAQLLLPRSIKRLKQAMIALETGQFRSLEAGELV